MFHFGSGYAGLGRWASSELTAPRVRWIVVLATIVAVTCISPAYRLAWRGYALLTSARAEAAGKPYLSANARDLKHTIVVPTLDAPLPGNTNVPWCATFQLAWNELCTLAEEDIHMDRKSDLSLTILLSRIGRGRRNLSSGLKEPQRVKR
ncbi:MAG: hypothetical protein WAX69_02550 [Victivallales bacterium]